MMKCKCGNDIDVNLHHLLKLTWLHYEIDTVFSFDRLLNKKQKLKQRREKLNAP